MNEIPSAPIPEARPDSVFQIWTKALTRPNESTYAELATSPSARSTTAFLWVFIAGLIQFLLSVLVQRQMLNNFQQYGIDLGDLGPRSGVGAILVGLICVAPSILML